MLRFAKVTALVTREEISEWEEADTGILAFWRVELQYSVFRLRAFMPVLGLNHGPLLKSQRGASARWVLQHSLPLLLKQIRHCIDSLPICTITSGHWQQSAACKGQQAGKPKRSRCLACFKFGKVPVEHCPWLAFSCDTWGLMKTGAPDDPYCSTWV